MSKVAIKGASTGTATFTIESPATNTDRTLVLPDNAGTIVTKASTYIAPSELGAGTADNTTFLRGDNTWAAVAGGGKVLQVVQATYSTELATTSTSYVDTNLSVSITPTSASSKILVLVNQQVSVARNSNNVIRVDCQIVRASTSVYTQGRILGGRAGTSAFSDVYYVGSFNGTYLDSPNTTSSTTYKTQGRVSTSDNGGTAFFQESGQNSTITLVEIAA